MHVDLVVDLRRVRTDPDPGVPLDQARVTRRYLLLLGLPRRVVILPVRLGAAVAGVRSTRTQQEPRTAGREAEPAMHRPSRRSDRRLRGGPPVPAQPPAGA